MACSFSFGSRCSRRNEDFLYIHIMRGGKVIALSVPLLFQKIFLSFIDYKYYQSPKSLIRQALSTVAGSVAEGSGSTTSTAMEIRQS